MPPDVATDRRSMLLASAGAALVGASALANPVEPNPTPRKGRIKQSLVHWCYAPFWEPAKMVEVAKGLGCASIELIPSKHFPLLKANGLDCAIGSIDLGDVAPFVRGFNNPNHREQVVKATVEAIDACSASGFKRVIAFTGMAEGMSRDEGAANCVEGFKQVVGHAEGKGVVLCLEMLNTRASDHPMKGHPGYQGDHTEYCIDIIKRVGSPNLKLLFDIYHVQIMDGDVIRRIRQHREHIGHIHTAGNPGRGELDDRQEIQYSPIMRALLDAGYQGFVGHEFIPTRVPLEGLKQAVALCDV